MSNVCVCLVSRLTNYKIKEKRLNEKGKQQ